MNRSSLRGTAKALSFALAAVAMPAVAAAAPDVCSPWLAQATVNNLDSGQVQRIDNAADLPPAVRSALSDSPIDVAYRYRQHYLIRLATGRGDSVRTFHLHGERVASEPASMVPEFACFTSEQVVFARQGDGAYSVTGPWRQ